MYVFGRLSTSFFFLPKKQLRRTVLSKNLEPSRTGIVERRRSIEPSCELCATYGTSIAEKHDTRTREAPTQRNRAIFFPSSHGCCVFFFLLVRVFFFASACVYNGCVFRCVALRRTASSNIGVSVFCFFFQLFYFLAPWALSSSLSLSCYLVSFCTVALVFFLSFLLLHFFLFLLFCSSFFFFFVLLAGGRRGCADLLVFHGQHRHGLADRSAHSGRR